MGVRLVSVAVVVALTGCLPKADMAGLTISENAAISVSMSAPERGTALIEVFEDGTDGGTYRCSMTGRETVRQELPGLAEAVGEAYGNYFGAGGAPLTGVSAIVTLQGASPSEVDAMAVVPASFLRALRGEIESLGGIYCAPWPE